MPACLQLLAERARQLAGELKAGDVEDLKALHALVLDTQMLLEAPRQLEHADIEHLLL